MRPHQPKRRPLAVLIKATLVVVIAALLGLDPRSSDHGGNEAGHRAGISGEVRIVVEAHLAWDTRPEGRRA
jgi:hypothetical protein